MVWGELLGLATTAFGLFSDREQAQQSQSMADQLNQEYLDLVRSQVEADNALRDRVLGKIDAWEQELNRIYGDMDPYRAEVAAEADRRLRTNMDTVQKSVNAQQSQRLADRINRGVDLSTYDIAARTAENAAMSDLYSNAITEASQGALQFVQGLRGNELGEINTVYGAWPNAASGLIGAGRSAAGLGGPAETANINARLDQAAANNSYGAFGQAVQDVLGEVFTDTSDGYARTTSEGSFGSQDDDEAPYVRPAVGA